MLKFYDWNSLIIPLYITARASMALDNSNENLIDLNRRFHGDRNAFLGASLILSEDLFILLMIMIVVMLYYIFVPFIMLS